MIIKCIAQGHYCRCQWIRTGNLVVDNTSGVWFYIHHLHKRNVYALILFVFDMSYSLISTLAVGLYFTKIIIPRFL